MYNNKRVLAVISARGGSKGVPRKNIRIVAGKPLVAWTIEAAQRSRYLDRSVLSSDDALIIGVARRFGCEVPFVRPAELSGDAVSGIEPVLHALRSLKEKFDYVVLLQPTSPLRTARDIDDCIERCIRDEAVSCVSVVAASKDPSLIFYLGKKGRLKPVLKRLPVLTRQLSEQSYVVNGAVYVARTDWFLKNKKFIYPGTAAFVMPERRSLDIDTEWDMDVAEFALKSGAGHDE